MVDMLDARTKSSRKGVRSEAKLLSISQRALDYLIASRMLPTKRIGTRVLIPQQDLQRFARADHPQRLAG
jgi:excisionase family DNA binding protein